MPTSQLEILWSGELLTEPLVCLVKRLRAVVVEHKHAVARSALEVLEMFSTFWNTHHSVGTYQPWLVTVHGMLLYGTYSCNSYVTVHLLFFNTVASLVSTLHCHLRLSVSPVCAMDQMMESNRKREARERNLNPEQIRYYKKLRKKQNKRQKKRKREAGKQAELKPKEKNLSDRFSVLC